MRKLPDPARAATGPDLARNEGSEDGSWLSLQRGGDTGDASRTRSRGPQDGGELVEELELRLREWVERVDTLETEVGYLKTDLEVRIAYTRELERQLDEQVNAARGAEIQVAAMRDRVAYRVVDEMVGHVARRPALHRLGSQWARRAIAWRER